MSDDRMISLNSAIGVIEAGRLTKLIDAETSVNGLKALPSAQPVEDARTMCGECDAWNQYKNYPQPGWIPWDSGRLPEESGTYTVTAYDGATKLVTYAKYQKRLKRWNLTGSRAYWRVLAWLPPLEPWKGEQNG